MGTTTSITCDIDCKRPGYYILLKPTSFRAGPQKLNNDFNALPLEIQYFGVIGRVFDEERLDISTVEYTRNIQDLSYKTPYKMQVLMSDNGKDWKPATNVYEPITVGEIKTCKPPANIDVREILLGIAKPALSLNRYGGLYKTAAMDTRLQTIPSAYYKIVIDKLQENSHWLLSSVNAEAYIACKSEVTSKAFKGIPTSILKICMSDSIYFQKINKAIVELTTKADTTPSLRMSACQMLHKIIKMYPVQAEQVAKCLDLADFIHLNIYPQDKANVSTAIDLLQLLSVIPEFCKQVYSLILHDISSIPNIKLSHSGSKYQVILIGFDAFFEMLRWVIPIAEEEAISKLLHSISIKLNNL